jgi:Secretion system C-terminal sorting domain
MYLCTMKIGLLLVVNSWFCGNVAASVGNAHLNCLQIQTLKNIAQTCPIIGGPAVFQARSMINAYGDYTYNDAATCAAAGVAFRNQPKKEVIQAFSLSPNPCSNFTKLTALIGSEAGATVTVYDMLGKIIVVENWNSLNVPYHLSTANFPNGSYTVSIQTNTSISTRKITIVK